MLISDPGVSLSSKRTLQTSTRPAGNGSGNGACDHEVKGRCFESLLRVTGKCADFPSPFLILRIVVLPVQGGSGSKISSCIL
jgi:hypothetical protein